MNLTDKESIKNNSNENLSSMPKGVQLFLMFYIKNLSDKNLDDTSEDYRVLRDEITFKHPEIHIQEFVSQLVVGMALEKEKRLSPSFDLYNMPSAGFEKEIDNFVDMLIKSSSELIELYDNDEDTDERTNKMRELITKKYNQSDNKMLYVREFIGVIDEMDWHDLGYYFVQVFKGVRKADETIARTTVVDTKILTTDPANVFRDKFLKRNIPTTDNQINVKEDFQELLNADLRLLFEAYQPIMRAKKVYNFKKHLILIKWFNEFLNKNKKFDSFPVITQEVSDQIIDLHDKFRYGIEDFYIDLYADEIEEKDIDSDTQELISEINEYELIRKNIFQKLEKILESHMSSSPEIKPDMMEELVHDLESQVVEENSNNIRPELLNNEEVLSVSQQIAQSLLEEFFKA